MHCGCGLTYQFVNAEWSGSYMFFLIENMYFLSPQRCHLCNVSVCIYLYIKWSWMCSHYVHFLKIHPLHRLSYILQLWAQKVSTKRGKILFWACFTAQLLVYMTLNKTIRWIIFCTPRLDILLLWFISLAHSCRIATTFPLSCWDSILCPQLILSQLLLL